MSFLPINPNALQNFKARLHGELIDPGNERYESARRVWNGSIDKHPAFIICCVDVSDVITSIEFARSYDVTVAVRGGGRSLAGYGVCDDGVVIDLSRMKRILVDPQRRIAHAEAGLSNAEFLAATHPFGLATPTGTIGHVGLSGLTLGGGEGWLSGKYGLTSDNLLAIEIVTADGTQITASATEHPDLFWAVRGGGGNFGIITAFTFQLHPVNQVLRGSSIYPMAQAREVLQFYREYTWQCSDELTVYAHLMTRPDGNPVVVLDACYCGDDLTEGERVLAPLRTFGSPIVDLRPMSILEATTLSDAFSPPGRCISSQTQALTSLSDEVINIAIAYSVMRPSALSGVVFRHTHGAPTRIDTSATAISFRHEQYLVQVMAQWTQGEAQSYVDWVKHFRADLIPFANELISINYLGEVNQPHIQASYGSNYERLVHVKNMYDPTNFFHVNQNIEPSGGQEHELD